MSQKQYDKFFKKFGLKCKKLRLEKKWTQEDMISFGFSTRHYQRIESGLPINMLTALRLAEAFEVKLSLLLKDIGS